MGGQVNVRGLGFVDSTYNHIQLNTRNNMMKCIKNSSKYAREGTTCNLRGGGA